MWLDDDGEDEPTPGPVPDPSERIWRHPSEVAAERAMAAANAANQQPAPIAMPSPMAEAPSGGDSLVWPIAVVGGSIAVAAFGVLGLYTMGAPGTGAANTSVAMADSSTGSDQAADGDSLAAATGGARSLGSLTTLGSFTSLSGLVSDPSALGSPEAHVMPPTTLSPATSVFQTSTTVPLALDAPLDSTTNAPTEDSDRWGSEAFEPYDLDSPNEEPAQREPGEGATDASPLARYAIYATPDRDSQPIASFVSIENLLISSASAVGDREFVYVRAGAVFHRAQVTGRDPLTDVALIQPVEIDDALVLPTAEPATEPSDSARAVFVGYCTTDTPASNDEESASQDGTLDSGNDPTVDDGETSAEGNEGSLCGVRMPEPGKADADPTPTVPTGRTYPTDSPGQTLSNHIVYAPIKTHIRLSTEMSGAPLRDQQGHVLGMVVGGVGQYVFAIPIDRALNAAESLFERGIGSLAWIGVDTAAAEGGLEVLSVDERSPFADQLQPGDLMLKADGVSLKNRDHLIHLVREAGVGATVSISCVRADGPGKIDVVVAEIPPVVE